MKKLSTYLNIFKTVLLANTPQNILLAALLHLSSEQELIQDEVCLLKVEYNVQFADVAVVLVHLLDVAMHNFEADQFVVGGRATGDEEEGGVTTVNYLLVCSK